MKKMLFLLLFGSAAGLCAQQSGKSKFLKLKYTLPAGWNVEEFGGKSSWEEAGNAMCPCAGISFSKSHKDGKMHVVVYPSTQSGLDSAKRSFVGNLQFEDVEKYDKTRNKNFSFERKRSNFSDKSNNKKSYEVLRYFAKVDEHFYIFYTWQDSMNALNSTNERELYEMVNAIEPL
jgi:hypothetical protein